MKVRAKTKWEMWEITLRALRSFLSVPFPKNGRNLQKFPNLKKTKKHTPLSNKTKMYHACQAWYRTMLDARVYILKALEMKIFEIGKFL